MNLGIFMLTLVCLCAIIGMTSIVLSIVFETDNIRYIPTQPTRKVNDSPKQNKELDKDIERVFSTDDEEDDLILDEELVTWTEESGIN